MYLYITFFVSNRFRLSSTDWSTVCACVCEYKFLKTKNLSRYFQKKTVRKSPTNWMNLEIIIRLTNTQRERETYRHFSRICIWWHAIPNDSAYLSLQSLVINLLQYQKKRKRNEKTDHRKKIFSFFFSGWLFRISYFCIWFFHVSQKCCQKCFFQVSSNGHSKEKRI